MAEGLDVNKLRKKAFVRYHGIDEDLLRRHFVVSSGEGLLLTVPGIAQYRPFVQKFQPDLIIFDTKNALFPGEENSATDHGEMIRALNTVRKDAGGAAVTVIGHEGLANTGRSRGSNAEEAGSSTAIRITRDDKTGTFSALVKRDKSGDPDTQWHWRLKRVDVPRGEFMDPPSVCIPLSEEEVTREPFKIEGDWWDDDTPVPDDLIALKGNGRAQAILIYRVLRWVGGTHGLAVADVKAAVDAATAAGARTKYDRTKTRAALTLLTDAGVIEHAAGSSARWVLTREYAGPEAPK
jgi:hypothetical protein